MDLLDYLLVLGTALLLFSALLIRHFASPQTSYSVRLLATISFALAFSATVLLPVDLSITSTTQNNNDDNDNDNDHENYTNGTMLPWHILFWSTSFLAWIVLPLVREILLSGEFTLVTRFKDGVRKVLLGVLILLVVVTVFVIWLAIHLREFNVIPVLITLGNTYGLLIVALLLGYGLVAYPRSLWRKARTDYELTQLYLIAVKADDDLFEAVWHLQDVEFNIDSAVARIADLDENLRADVFYKYCVNQLIHEKNKTADLRPELHMRRTNVSSQRRLELEQEGRGGFRNGNRNGNGYDDINHAGSGDAGSGKPSLNELVKLNRKLKRAQENLFNADRRWNAILKKHAFFTGQEIPTFHEDTTTTVSSRSRSNSPTNGISHNKNSNSDNGNDNIMNGKSNHTLGNTCTSHDTNDMNDKNNDCSVRDDDQNNSTTTVTVPLSPNRKAAPLISMSMAMADADERVKSCNSTIKYIWIRYLRCFVYRLVAILAAALSCIILWSEATLASRFNLSPFAWVQEYLETRHDDGDDVTSLNEILFQIAALAPLLYMSICVADGLFSVGRFGPFYLRGNQQSHGVALVFNAQYLVRLQFPLAYNYLLMLKYDTSECAFSQFIGQMDVVPMFGKSFPVYAPLMILLLCALTLFNVYAKLLNLLGFEHSDALLVGDQETLDLKVNEGKTLLRQCMDASHKRRFTGNNTKRQCLDEDMVELAETKSWTSSIV